jgi:hypothetical protein
MPKWAKTALFKQKTSVMRINYYECAFDEKISIFLMHSYFGLNNKFFFSDL